MKRKQGNRPLNKENKFNKNFKKINRSINRTTLNVLLCGVYLILLQFNINHTLCFQIKTNCVKLNQKSLCC